jgi:monoamine oxidase
LLLPCLVLDVIVVGAGAAGLAAAHDLSKAGLRLAVLEARPRIGGRVFTVADPAWPVALELGAEFLHGAASVTRDIARSASLPLLSLADRHEWASGVGRAKAVDLWHRYDSLRKQIPSHGADLSFAQFLASRKGLGAATKRLGRMMVEGYEAAPMDTISSHSLALPPGAPPEDRRQARLPGGQAALMRWLAAGLDPTRATLHLGTVVDTVEWRRGRASVRTRIGAGTRVRRWEARMVVVTVPIGVLKAVEGPGAIRFTPPLPHARALDGLAMGHAIKVALRLRRTLWDEHTEFLHDPGAVFPTWWTQAPLQTPVITGWMGGRGAETLSDRSDPAVLAQAVRSLSGLLGRAVENAVEAWRWQDWSADPFSRGAYSHVLVGGLDAASLLARPVADTVYLAGEALGRDESGTVHAAFDSGRRAARRILAPRRGKRAAGGRSPGLSV